MTHEEIMGWLIGLMDLCIYVAAVCSTVLVIGFTVGYFSEKFALEARAEKEARCINSACDTKCKPNARFVRHEGCK